MGRSKLWRWSALATTLCACMSCDRGDAQSRVDPSDPAAMKTAMEAVEISLRNARVDEARRIATRLSEVASENGDVFELLARVEIARSLESSDPELRALARRAAANAYARAVEKCEPNAGLLNAAGVAAQGCGDLTTAIAFFDRAAKIDPANPQHPLFAGLAALSLGRHEEARTRLTFTRSLDPKSPWPVSALSGVALLQGDAETALALAREARRLDPRLDELRVPEAKALRKLARHQEVLTLLLALPEKARMTEPIAWEIAAAQEAMGESMSAAITWGRWAEFCGSADAAADAARRWTAAGDPIQAHTWMQLARHRGWRGADANARATQPLN